MARVSELVGRLGYQPVAGCGSMQLFDVTNARAPVNSFADRQAQGEGLETLAGVTRGALFTVTVIGENVFDATSRAVRDG